MYVTVGVTAGSLYDVSFAKPPVCGEEVHKIHGGIEAGEAVATPHRECFPFPVTRKLRAPIGIHVQIPTSCPFTRYERADTAAER